MNSEDQTQTAQPDASGYQQVWALLSGYRWAYGLAVLGLFIAACAQFLVPLIGSATIDYVLNPDGSRSNPLLSAIIGMVGGAEAVSRNLWLPALAMVLFSLVGGLFNFLQKRWSAQASDGICKRIKDQLYDHMQRLSNRYLDGAQTGDLVQRCTSDVETIRIFLAAHVVEIGRATVLLVTVIPIMLLMNAKLTLVSTALLPVIVLFGYFYFKRVQSQFKEVDEAEGRLTARVQENITGIRVVRAFGRHDYEIEQFDKPNREYRDTSLKLIRMMAGFWSPSDMISLSQICLALVYGSYLAIQGQTSIGTLFAFLALLGMVLWPVRMLGRVLTDLGKTMVAVSRINEILNEPMETQSDEPAASLDRPISGHIVMRKVSFAHNEETNTVEDVSFEIKPGETLAILGPSGAGKSTLLHLLLRFYDADSGEILLDGKEIKTLDRHQLRQQFGVVMQEPFLYSRTIRENIRFGVGAASNEAVERVARMACIHDTISNFSDGYETEIGERGITLSGGQRQRVAISRALLRNPPVLLLDDALSAVDNETESAIIDALGSRRGRHTTIVIAHRLSTLAHADKIIVMDQGRIIQTGTHQTLLQEEGLYKRLWEIQTELEQSFSEEAVAARK